MTKLEAPIPGVWWLPGPHRRRFRRGVLQKLETGIELKLEKAWPRSIIEEIESTRYVTLWGKDERGRKISLFGAFLVKWGMLLPERSPATFSVDSAFLGTHCKSSDDAELVELGARFPALDKWLGISGLTVTPQEGLDLEVHFSPPKSLEFDLGQGLRLVFWFGWQGPTFQHPQLEIAISQKCELILRSTSRRKFGELHTIYSRMTNLFSLLIGEAVSHEALWARMQKMSQQRATVDILYDPVAPEIVGKVVERHRMLLGFEDILINPAQLFRLWLDKYEIYHRAFDIYFSVQLRDPGFQEQRFLSAVQALEILHRLGNQYPPSSEHLEKIDRIVMLVESKDRKWLKGRLKYSHEPSLMFRLEDLVSTFGDLFGNPEERCQFIQKVADTRNYLTHYDPKLENKAVESGRLLPFIFRLRVLFVLRCLLEIGISPVLAQQIVEKNDRLRQMVHFREI